MGIKSFKPYTPSRRFMTVSSFEEITTDKPEKSLLAPLKKNGGRNQQGRLTVRHRGGGVIVSLILNATKTVFRQQLQRLNTIQTAVQELHYCTMQTEKRDILLRQTD